MPTLAGQQGADDLVRYEAWVDAGRLNDLLRAADVGGVAQNASPYSNLVTPNSMTIAGNGKTATMVLAGHNSGKPNNYQADYRQTGVATLKRGSEVPRLVGELPAGPLPDLDDRCRATGGS